MLGLFIYVLIKLLMTLLIPPRLAGRWSGQTNLKTKESGAWACRLESDSICPLCKTDLTSVRIMVSRAPVLSTEAGEGPVMVLAGGAVLAGAGRAPGVSRPRPALLDGEDLQIV